MVAFPRSGNRVKVSETIASCRLTELQPTPVMSLHLLSLPRPLPGLLALLWFVAAASPDPAFCRTLDEDQAALCDLYMYDAGTPGFPQYNALCRYNGCPETECQMMMYTTFVPGGFVENFWCSCDGAQELCCHLVWSFENGEGYAEAFAVGFCRPAAGPGYCPEGSDCTIEYLAAEPQHAKCQE